ncbi:MAG: hypothetical protein AAF152_17535 [Cyanobacteria bacterium P01_A01_bin.114]
MTDPPIEIDIRNQEALAELAWAIDASQGEFKLLFARCNYAQLRQVLIDRLQSLCTVALTTLTLEPTEQTLYTTLQTVIGEIPSETPPEAIMVIGLDTLQALDEVLIATNKVRDDFRRSFPFPLVLWITDDTQQRLTQHANDFESWGVTTEFEMPPEMLNQALQQAADRLFETLLTPDSNQPFEHLLAEVDLGFLQRSEMQAALTDLHGQPLAPELQASIDFALGLEADTPQTALTYFERSSDFWQAQADSLKTGLVMFYVGKTRYALADQDRTEADWQSVLVPLQQSLEIFDSQGRPDLAAKGLIQTMRVWQHLHNWQQVATLAEWGMTLHQTHGPQSFLAQDYGFLARATLAQEQWSEAETAAQQGLALIDQCPGDQRWLRQLYFLFLAQAQLHQAQSDQALANLEAAKELGDQGHPQVSIDVFRTLWRLYRERKDYLNAFEARQSRRSIEQQYGMRAFVGAGRLQAKRIRQEDAAPSLAALEDVAPEIAASGRQHDLENLLERIGRNDSKLIVLHGSSGVGKSSLINSGLMPSLREQTIGIRPNLPVLLRTYTDWAENLAAQIVTDREHGSGVAEPATERILHQLREWDQRSLRPVLIFDQFEEFFFANSDPLMRRQFFEVLGKCLNIGSVKAVLSLREDYIHYLLACNRLEGMHIIGQNILSTQVLYPVGNFSIAEAKQVVRNLTSKTPYSPEPTLIDAFVEDLAGKLQEVRPIELQIVGVQLQAKKITTRQQYEALGKSPKSELIRRYLNEVVSDCGVENEQLAQLVLFLLTDERGTRPLKTRLDLERELETIKALSPLFLSLSSLTLILQILAGSGIIVHLPDTPDDRYQLVHDYLAEVIRQEFGPQQQLAKELAEERQRREAIEAEKSLLKKANQVLATANRKANSRMFISTILLLASTIFAAVAIPLITMKAAKEQQLATDGARLERSGVSVLRRFEFQETEALSSALTAANKLKQLIKEYNIEDLEKYPAASPLLALQTSIDNIREKRLDGSPENIEQQIMYVSGGQQIATRSKGSSTVRIWDREGNMLDEILVHQKGISDIVFSPDGKHFVTSSSDSTARLWDLEGNQLAVMEGHNGSVWHVAFSPNGHQIATSGEDGTARLWDLEGNQLAVMEGRQGDIYQVVYSPNGQQIATRVGNGTARLWDLEGNQLAVMDKHQGWVEHLVFSPDGQQIATSGADGTARLWDLEGEQLAVMEGHQGKVSQIAFSPDEQHIATSGEDGTARLWDLEGKQLAVMEGHQRIVYQIAFNPEDGQQIVTSSADSTARLWDLEGNELTVMEGHQGIIKQAVYSPDGQQIATSSADGTARLWNLEGNQLAVMERHQRSISHVAFSPDGQQITTSGEDGTARLWNLEGNELAVMEGHQGDVLQVVFSPDGQQIATSGEDGTARLWDLEGNELAVMDEHQGKVLQVVFSPNGQQIATRSEDKSYLWDLEGNWLAETDKHQGKVWQVVFSPGGQQIATSSTDGTARLWDLEGNELAVMDGHQGKVWQVVFSPDGQQIATRSEDGTARLWDLEGNELAVMDKHQGWVEHVVFSPDGQQIATSGADGTVRLWDLEGNQSAVMEGHQGKVFEVLYSPDEQQQIASRGEDGTTRLWDLRGQQIAQYNADRMAINPDWTRIATVQQPDRLRKDAVIKLWRINDLDGLLVRACEWLQPYLLQNNAVTEADREMCGL